MVKRLPVLVAYEESGIVTAALRSYGIEAYSNDIAPTRGNPKWHIQGDAMEVIFSRRWAALIAHPVCTYMANSGAKHLYVAFDPAKGKNEPRWRKLRKSAREFKRIIEEAPAEYVVAENPIMLGYAQKIIGRGPDQIVQPWQFGHEEMKATCFWRRGDLPDLWYTDIVGPPPEDKEEKKKWEKVFRCGPGPNRQRERDQKLNLESHSPLPISMGHILEERSDASGRI